MLISSYNCLLQTASWTRENKANIPLQLILKRTSDTAPISDAIDAYSRLLLLKILSTTD